MTTSPHEELTAATVIGLIESGAYPRDIVVTIARGFLPLAQEDLVAVLASVAAQYILLAAEFVAATQVLVYIGAIVVLFLFVVPLIVFNIIQIRKQREIR